MDLGTPDYCYKILNNPSASYEAAISECVLDGGHFASIHNENINSLLHAEIVKLDLDFWIGLHFKTSETRKLYPISTKDCLIYIYIT